MLNFFPFFFLSVPEYFKEEEVLQNHLHQMSTDDQYNLCVVANNHADFGAMKEGGFISKEHYKISFINGKTEYTLGITCPTEPELTLYLGKSNYDIKLVMLDPFLSRFKFRWHVVESISRKI